MSPDDSPLMSCTACSADCTNTADEVVEMFSKVRGHKRRAKLIALAAANWLCDECLDEAERKESLEPGP